MKHTIYVEFVSEMQEMWNLQFHVRVDSWNLQQKKLKHVNPMQICANMGCRAHECGTSEQIQSNDSNDQYSGGLYIYL